MTVEPLFWLGLAAASGAGLLLSLLQLQKRRGELTAAQSEAVAQKTAAALANERNHALESELSTLQQSALSSCAIACCSRLLVGRPLFVPGVGLLRRRRCWL